MQGGNGKTVTYSLGSDGKLVLVVVVKFQWPEYSMTRYAHILFLVHLFKNDIDEDKSHEQVHIVYSYQLW